MIKIFRSRCILRWSILATLTVFLNMNFFLLEVSALELDKDKQMARNIAQLIASASNEEEKDIFGNSETKDLVEPVTCEILSKDKLYLLPFQIAFQARDGAKPIS